MELQFGASLPAVLRKLRAQGLSAAGVARRVGLSYRTVHRWLVDYELDDAALVRKALSEPVGAIEDRCGMAGIGADE